MLAGTVEYRDLSWLVPEFKDKVVVLLEACQQRGYELVPFYTLRGPVGQAKLWRQSRSTLEIQRAVKNLRRDAPTLVRVIEGVGPQYGRWATNALPGQSWHQWGEAIDCFVLNTMGQAVWSSQHSGYRVYAEEAKRIGLTPGHFWKNKDSVHVQLRERGVREERTWLQIEEAMVGRFLFDFQDGRPSNKDLTNA